MNSRFAIILIVIAGLFAGTTVLAQRRNYDQVMKDIGATFASLKKNLDANTAAAAAEDAGKLEGFFKETEAFWTTFQTRDAIGFAKGAQEAAAAVGAAAKGNDIKAAQASYARIGRSCAGCHLAHREELQKGFRIRP
jgi:cytochrome c556